MLRILTLLATLTLLTACASTIPDATVLKNTVTWATASEVRNFGYDVYRGDSKEGPFMRLTRQPVAGAGTTDQEQHYQFIDDTIEPGLAYFYYVESISLSGVRERFTPVFGARPKYP